MLRSDRRPLFRSRPTLRWLAIIATLGSAAALTGVGAAAAAPTGSPGAPGSPGTVSDHAAAQIAALQQIKQSLTPAEQKLDSHLVVALRERSGQAVKAALPKVSTGVTVSPTGRTTVDVTVTAVTTGLLARFKAIGASVTSGSKRLGTVRVEVPLGAMTTVASWTDVRQVSLAAGMMTARESGRGVARSPAETKAQHAARVDAQLRRALAASSSQSARAATPNTASQGSVVSEGDRTEAADKARATFKVTGVGVKVCVLSDGVDLLAASQATGDLPTVDVLPGQAGGGDEGTAMLEIVHDLAPSATLGFATANNGDSVFADNILDLRFVLHCDVIVDDVLYFNEDPFQDGPIAQSVNQVTADGAIYFSSAGNEGNTIDRTSGNYEGTFVDSGQSVGRFAGQANDFDSGAGVQIFDPLSAASGENQVPIVLWWADPLHHAADDYDLYLFDSAGNVTNFSQDIQNGTQNPFEILRATGEDDLRVAVVKFSGEARYFQLSALRGRFASSADGLVGRSTPGVTRGHSAAVNAFSVAAVPADIALPFDLEPGDPPNPTGPFPNPFTRAQKPERFTSDGPRRMFFTVNGTPITPGNFTSTGGTVRLKPDIAAADGVSTTQDPLSGLNPFFGTSAAAPHAAAIAALVLSGNPGASTSFLRKAFTATALDLAPAGIDTRTGHGIIRADRVLANTGATPQAQVVSGDPAATVTVGDGDPFLEPGETARLAVPAINSGDGSATNVTVHVVSADPLATLTPATQAYGTVAAGATKTMPFTLKLAATYPRGKPVSLTATVTFTGGQSPTTTTLTIPVSQPSTSATTFAYTGPAVAIPDNDPAGVSVAIPVSGVGFASDLTFSVDGSACSAADGSTTVGIDHTFVSDLVATLTNPSGQTVTVFAGDGGAGNNLCQVVFDDTAATPFGLAASAQEPFTGTWAPDEALGAFLSAPVDGSWTFHVEDTASADTGNVRAVSLHIKGFQS